MLLYYFHCRRMTQDITSTLKTEMSALSTVTVVHGNRSCLVIGCVYISLTLFSCLTIICLSAYHTFLYERTHTRSLPKWNCLGVANNPPTAVMTLQNRSQIRQSSLCKQHAQYIKGIRALRLEGYSRNWFLYHLWLCRALGMNVASANSHQTKPASDHVMMVHPNHCKPSPK